MIRTISIAALCVATPFAAQAQAGGKWEVKVAPAECSLIRAVQGDAPALFAVRTVPGTDDFTVLVGGKGVPDRSRYSNFAAKVKFDNSAPIEAQAQSVGKLSVGPTLQLSGLEPALLDTFAGAHKVEVGTGEHSFFALDLPSARAAIGALRQCIADQLIEWGADPAQFAPGGTLPVALKDRDDWLTTSQLLTLGSAASGTEIDYLYRVGIAPDGSIDSCRRDDPKADARTQKLGCDPLLGKKLFTPARNAAGVPVKGAAAFRVMLVKRARSS